MRLTLSTMSLLSSLVLVACTASEPEPTQGGGGKADGVECPVEGDADAVQEAIEKAGSCFNAANIAEACAYGSNIDRSFVDAATALCTASFEGMTRSHEAMYEDLLERCGTKYAEYEGSMFRSFTAYCELEVTRLFNRLYPEQDVTDPLVEVVRSCPVPALPEGGVNVEGIERAIGRASSCGSAADLAEDCAFGGGGGDAQLAFQAADRCLQELPDLDSSETTLLAKMTDACETMAPEEEGSLGRMLRAYCSLQAHVVLSSILSPVED